MTSARELHTLDAEPTVATAAPKRPSPGRTKGRGRPHRLWWAAGAFLACSPGNKALALPAKARCLRAEVLGSIGTPVAGARPIPRGAASMDGRMTDSPPDAQASPPPEPAPTIPSAPPAAPTPPASPLYKGEPLDAERGPGLGCFWTQAVVLVVVLLLIPFGVNAHWPIWATGLLLVARADPGALREPHGHLPAAPGIGRPSHAAAPLAIGRTADRGPAGGPRGEHATMTAPRHPARPA